MRKKAVQGRDSSAIIFHTSSGVPMVGMREQNLRGVSAPKRSAIEQLSTTKAKEHERAEPAGVG